MRNEDITRSRTEIAARKESIMKIVSTTADTHRPDGATKKMMKTTNLSQNLQNGTRIQSVFNAKSLEDLYNSLGKKTVDKAIQETQSKNPQDVCKSILSGTPKEIAKKLGITAPTLEHHKEDITNLAFLHDEYTKAGQMEVETEKALATELNKKGLVDQKTHDIISRSQENFEQNINPIKYTDKTVQSNEVNLGKGKAVDMVMAETGRVVDHMFEDSRSSFKKMFDKVRGVEPPRPSEIITKMYMAEGTQDFPVDPKVLAQLKETHGDDPKAITMALLQDEKAAQHIQGMKPVKSDIHGTQPEYEHVKDCLATVNSIERIEEVRPIGMALEDGPQKNLPEVAMNRSEDLSPEHTMEVENDAEMSR